MLATAIRDYTLDERAPKPISSKKQHEEYVAAVLDLERRANPTAKDRAFAELLILLIEAYEKERYPIRAATPREVLAELLDVNDLRQKDLAPIFGGEGVVSEVLNGKRELNKHHIERLAEKFGVSPAVFF
jgi:HTH-type transcriptional regulator / antitoxin HigA